MVPLALLCLVVFARADGDANISGDSQFAAEFGNFGKVPCRFGDALVPHGEWRAGMRPAVDIAASSRELVHAANGASSGRSSL